MRPEGPLANFRSESTGKRGVPITVTVHYVASSGAMHPGWVRADVDETLQVISVRGATKYVEIIGAASTQMFHYPSASTTFTPQNAGIYTLKGTLSVDTGTEAQTGGYAHLLPTVTIEKFGAPQTVEVSQRIEITE
ncbi:MAG: hypothetical protein JWM96_1395 [Alphaproteobacteria bacterium]|nr:hypothetical protein [Alphaproteobacteria bacterium]